MYVEVKFRLEIPKPRPRYDRFVCAVLVGLGFVLMTSSRSWAAIGLAVALAGCTVGPDYQTPAIDMPGGFVAEATAGSTRARGSGAVDLRQWWRSLRDRELDSLVDRALTSNLDLEIALTRILEAQTRIVVTSAQALPRVSATGGGGGGTGTDETKGRTDSVFRAAQNSTGLQSITQSGGLVADWELDLFGRVRRLVEAEIADVEALKNARDWIYVTVAADVAAAYLDMRSLQSELAVLGQNIEVAKDAVALTQSRFDRGLTNELDVTLAERQLATLQAVQEPLRAQIEASQHAIATLLGQYPEEMKRELARPGPVPPLPARIPIGLPVDLLRRRPDILEIERRLVAANARIGAAIAELFPTVVLTGAGGGQGGPRSSTTVSPATLIWTVGPAISVPVLDFGALDAQIEAADLRTQEILLVYRQAILTAVQQVDDAGAIYHAQRARVASLDRAVSVARQATKIATERYDRGLTDFLNVLDAQRQQFDLEESRVAAAQVAARALVALFKALGGGWPLHETIPVIRRMDPAAIAAAKYLLAPRDTH